MKTKFYFAHVCLAVALIGFFTACSKNPNSPVDTSEESGSYAKIAADNGSQVFRSVQTLNELKVAVAGPQAYGEIELPAVGSIASSGQLLSKHRAHVNRSLAQVSQQPDVLRKASGDSVIFENWWTDPETGVEYHTVVTYDSDTGKAVATIDATNFPAEDPREQEHARITIDTNFTLADSTDDVVERLEARKDYRDFYRLQFEEASLIPDEYEPGTEPTGGIIDARKAFNAGEDTTEAVYHLEYHESSGGNFSESAKFEDGTSYSVSATFSEGKINLSAAYRDGSTEQTEIISQSENDLSFTKRLTFAPGSDPRSIFESGEYTMNPADSSATADYVSEIHYADGTSERHEIHASEKIDDGFRRAEVSASSSDGTSVNWVLQEGADKDRLEGNAIDEELRYIVFDADFYHDGSADLHLEVYASKEAFDKGEPPIFVADLHYRPDGSGTGTVTSNKGIETFEFGIDGRAKTS